MAAFLRQMMGGVMNMAQATLQPYKVQTTDEKITCQVIEKNGHIVLYKEIGSYNAILHDKIAYAIPFSLFRVTNEAEAIASFRIIADRLRKICASTSLIYKDTTLQQVCDCLRDHPLWSAAHVAAFVGLSDAFRNYELKQEINHRCSQTGETPLMSAIKMDRVDCVGQLLLEGADTGIVDNLGNSVYHHAVKTSKDCIPVLTTHNQHLINRLNDRGESPMTLACSLSRHECTESLLKCGAHAHLPHSQFSAVHVALKQNDLKSAELIINKHPDQLNARDKLHGGTPLHWAKTKQAVCMLLEKGCDTNRTSNDHSTALHVMMSRERSVCAMTLLCHGVDVNIRGEGGNTPLHYAVILDDLTMVQTLVVFGADVNAVNDYNHTPRHLAASKDIKNCAVMVFVLHSAGAHRCTADVKGCLNGCDCYGRYNGVPDDTMKHMMESLPKSRLHQLKCDDVLRDSLLISLEQQISNNDHCADRVLCLDGGGIRGVILIQLLMAIQEAAGKPIIECFDWIGGTSTGGILALSIASGRQLPQILGMYLRMKEKIFVGDRPHPNEPLEAELKQQFGETRMCDLTGPKVMVTAVMADRDPPVLHLFRNYVPPVMRNISADMNTLNHGNFKKPPPPSQQLVWKSALCSGAAPTYFRACDFFVDGGVIANNPTLDVITEIHEYNTGKKLMMPDWVAPKIGVVVSLGTGRNPVVPVKSIDVFRPSGIKETIDVVKGLNSLVSMLTEQLTESDGSTVDRARAWCSMIGASYYRLSPCLRKAVPLNSQNDEAVLSMMWETHCYITMKRELIRKIAAHL